MSISEVLELLDVVLTIILVIFKAMEVAHGFSKDCRSRDDETKKN